MKSECHGSVKRLHILGSEEALRVYRLASWTDIHQPVGNGHPSASAFIWHQELWGRLHLYLLVCSSKQAYEEASTISILETKK